MSEISIRPATKDDLKQIVRIHQEAFPGFFLTRMGKRFLRLYYQLVLEYQEHIFLIAENPQSQIVGFACGVYHPKNFYQFLKKSKYRFLLPVLIALLRNPFLVREVFSNKNRVETISDSSITSNSEKVFEFTSMGVSNRALGLGVGKQLTLVLLQLTRENNTDYVILTTDKDNNEHVNRFHTKMGFQLRREVLHSSNRVMNEYVYVFKDSNQEDI